MLSKELREGEECVKKTRPTYLFQRSKRSTSQPNGAAQKGTYNRNIYLHQRNKTEFQESATEMRDAPCVFTGERPILRGLVWGTID